MVTITTFITDSQQHTFPSYPDLSLGTLENLAKGKKSRSTWNILEGGGFGVRPGELTFADKIWKVIAIRKSFDCLPGKSRKF